MRIDPQKDALIVVDLQPDFMPGGALPVPGGDEIVEPISRLVKRFQTVVATQDFHPAGHISFASTHGKQPFEGVTVHGAEQRLWPEHCVAGSPGAAVHPALPDHAVTLYVRKGTRPDVDSYSAFRENVGPDGTRPSTGLGAFLRARGIERVFVVGLARDYCVKATALDAADEGFETVVIEDLTRAVEPARVPEVDRELRDHRVKLLNTASLS